MSSQRAALPRNSLDIGSYNAPAALLGDFLGLDELPKNHAISKLVVWRSHNSAIQRVKPSVGGSNDSYRAIVLNTSMHVSSVDFCLGKTKVRTYAKTQN